MDQHIVERNKAVSLRWHQAWGTPDIESAYRECLRKISSQTCLVKEESIARSSFGGIGYLHRPPVKIVL